MFGKQVKKTSLLAEKIEIPDENLEVPEFKLKVVVLDYVGDSLEKKARKERVDFMRGILVCLGAKRDLPSLEEEDDGHSRPIQTSSRGLLDGDIGDRNKSGANMSQDGTDGGVVKVRKGRMSVESNLNAHESGVNMRSSLFRREFCITGSIGEAGQSEKLNFVSLANQIDSGLRKGYDEDEIVDGVIQAITPGLHLRSFLEASPNLTLGFVRKTLRSHYREKDATSLYQELAVCHQKGNETPMTFLMRALDLRQKVLFSCQEQDARIKYDREIVQKTFINALKTGLRDDNIAASLRGFLTGKGIKDEDLMGYFSDVVSLENERQMRFSSKGMLKESKRVNSVKNVEENWTKESRKETKSKEAGESKLLAVVEKLQAEVSSLREEVAKQRTQQQPPVQKQHISAQAQFSGETLAKRGCQACRVAGKEAFCQHCFYCGSPDHFQFQCPQKAKIQGNQVRQSPGDRV